MLRVLLSAALVAMMMAGPAHARGERFEPPPSGVFEFVGFSVGTVTGGVGIPAMHATCQADFGADSRMCTSEEYFLSPAASAPGPDPADWAWVHPGPFGSSFEFTSISTLRSCDGWGVVVNTKFGATVMETGIVRNVSCDNAQLVTCCARLK